MTVTRRDRLAQEEALRRAVRGPESRVRLALVRQWRGMRAGYSYAEIERALEAGLLVDPVKLDEWRAGYAAFISDEWGPEMRRAQTAGAATVAQVVDMGAVAQSIDVAIAARGARLLTEVTDDQRRAVQAVMRHFTVDRPTNPREAARYVRPLIGLTSRDAELVARRATELRDAGASADDVSKLVDLITDRKERERSLSIARTESSAAFNDGARLGAERAVAEGAGVAEQPTAVWVTARDELVCDRCSEMDRTVIPFGTTFDDRVGGVLVQNPPLHPNCRCTVVFDL